MTILAIESSCDETSASVMTDSNGYIEIKSNTIASSLDIHSTTGGIIPENAARMQVKYIIPVIADALIKSKNNLPIEQFSYLEDKSNHAFKIPEEKLRLAKSILKSDIDAIAITYGPGLIGSLLVGVETAKTLAFVFNKPLIPVNHLLAHIYANFISSNHKSSIVNHTSSIEFPFVGLIVSGGHTDLLYFESDKKFKWLGGTRDDAAGEAMDKIGRLLNIPYPAGPEIEKLAEKAKEKKLRFKSPLIGSDDLDFSFSGLKTEVLRFVQKNPEMSEDLKNEICYSTQKTIIDVLIKKTLKASEKFNCKTILVGGGVSANQTLMENLKLNAKRYIPDAKVFSPEKTYCTDNAAMIGAYALLNYETKPWQKVTANPELYFE